MISPKLLRQAHLSMMLALPLARGMKYVTLGAGLTALEGVSEVMLGTMTWGEQNTEEEAHAQLDLALAMGVNFIDTAELYPVPPTKTTYGETERIIGRWLSRDPSLRARVILATKVAGDGREYIKAARGADIPSHDGSNGHSRSAKKCGLWREQIMEALDASLARLQTSYIDLYQLHWPARYTPIFSEKRYERRKEKAASDVPSIDEQVLAIKDCLESGKIRAWGLSNENAVGVSLFLESCRRLGVPPPATIQNDFSIAHRRFEEDGTAEVCSPLLSGAGPKGIALLAYGTLAGGTLTGKVVQSLRDGDKTPDKTRLTDQQHANMADEKEVTILAPSVSRHVLFPHFQPRYYSKGTVKLAEKYAALARELDLTPTQLALVWARQREYIGAVIIGATSLEQLKENILAFELPGLSRSTLRRIDAIDHQLASAYYQGVQPGVVKGEEVISSN